MTVARRISLPLPEPFPPKLVRDVLVVPTSEAGAAEWDDHPPVGDEPFDLGSGLTLERLDEDLAEQVMDACSQRGLNWELPTRQFRHRYAFVWRPPDQAAAAGRNRWDDETEIWRAVLMSRLVVDNGYGTEYAARVVEREDAPLQIVPVFAPSSVATHRLYPEQRDWLTVTEAEQLRELVEALRARAEQLPPRVIRALNRAEDAVTSRYWQQQVVQVGIGLEALVTTDRDRTTRDFKVRVAALSRVVGGEALSVTKAAQLYEARSDAAHGGDVRLFSPRDTSAAGVAGGDPPGVALVSAGLRILRATIRSAILDPDFASVFVDEASIEARFPTE